MISICIKVNNNTILNYLHDVISNSNNNEIFCKKHSFKLYDNIIVHYIGNNSDYFYDFVGDILTNVIFIFFEQDLIKKIISSNYFYFNKNDRKVILDEYKLIVSDQFENHLSKLKILISDKFKKFFLENKSVILNGFINFRLKEYFYFLETLVSKSVEQFVVDREYIQFVELLRNYVRSKTSNSSIVHLIYINSEGILLSENGNVLELEDFNSSIYLSDISFSKNDYVLNTLIGILPSKIMLHLVSKEDQFIDTVHRIFEEKVELCNGCELCKAYKLLNLH